MDEKLPKLWCRGRIEYERDINEQLTKKLKFVEDYKGPWLVNLQGFPTPELKKLHIAGFDDTYKGRKESNLPTQDSKNCMIIYRRPTSHNLAHSDMPVAIYLRQTPDMNDVYDECLRGLKFWEVEQCLYNYNHEGFLKFLQQAGEAFRLFWVGANPGLKLTQKVKAKLTKLSLKYRLARQLTDIENIRVLDELDMWTLNAFLLVCFLLNLDDTEGTVLIDR